MFITEYGICETKIMNDALRKHRFKLNLQNSGDIIAQNEDNVDRGVPHSEHTHHEEEQHRRRQREE